MEGSMVNMKLRRPLIRPALYSDAVEIQNTLWQCQMESETPYPDPDIPYAAQKLMSQATEGLIQVAVAEEGIVGVIVLGEAVWPWKHPDSLNSRYLVNEHFYVKKPYRRGGTAKHLLEWSKKKSNELGLMLMLDFSTIDADIEIKDRFARINGFRYIGGKFMRLPSSDTKEA